jgi:pimeloyl-ACP methyl ester carboxylesterase
MPRIKTNGTTVNYEERGSGEPLMLLMGLGAPGAKWADHAAAYAQHFRCFLIDNRGAGQSDQPAGPYTTRMLADDVAGLMQAVGIARARVAGLSMGSGIAQELALAYPHMVRSLVLVSSWARCDRYTRAVLEHFRTMRAVAAPADFVQLLQLWIACPAYYETRFDQMRQDQAGAAEGYMPLPAFQAQCDACMTHEALERLGQIAAPALLTVGDADIFTPLRLTAAMAERMPGAQVEVFPGGGHIHHWEDLARFNEVTTRFLLAH